MTPLTDNENKFYEENVAYVKKSFVLIKMKKRNLNYIKKLENIVIMQENLEEQLMVFAV